MNRALLTAVSLALMAVLAGCQNGLPSSVIYPSITLDEAAEGQIPVSTTFSFEGEPVTISITVDAKLYSGASAAVKTVTRFGNSREDDWMDDYFPAFAIEENHVALYEQLLTALRAVKQQRGLDSDRYVELLTVFAQSIEYHTDPVDLEPKFPVETVVDGAGDCDDKALLLAGLLAREGYDVAILLFEPEKHVALGIRSDEIDYKGTGYAYTETTTQAFIGMVPDEFAGGVTLTSEPAVFKIGDGTTAYTAGAEVQVILEGRQRAIEQAAQLAEEIGAADQRLVALEQQVRALSDQLSYLRETGRTQEHNALVPLYNQAVETFNTVAEERNLLVERHNSLAVIDRIIVEGMDNRVGTYHAVSAVVG